MGGSLAAKVEVVEVTSLKCMHIHYLKAFIPRAHTYIHDRFKLYYLLRSLVLLAAAAEDLLAFDRCPFRSPWKCWSLVMFHRPLLHLLLLQLL